MSWASAIRKPAAQTKVAAAVKIVSRPQIETADVDWDRLVSLDFETYYDADYTLSKLSTSEYVRDERFEASMVGIKIGNKKTKVVPHNKIAAELAKINWATHSVLCHNVQFDGFILSHHYGVYPKRYYCTLGMARGLHSNEIGAGLHDVSVFYGGKGKIEDGVENMKGVRFKELFANKPLWNRSVEYCANDVDEMFRIFCAMHPLFPAKEMDLIHMTARMFCAPVLRVDIPRVQAEYEREVTRREELLLNLLDPRQYDDILDGKDKKLEGKERDMRIVKKVVGSNERFVALFENLGIARDQLPRKLSPAWMKKNKAEQEASLDTKWAFAFAKDDLEFLAMPDKVWEYFPHLDPNNPDDALEAAELSEKLQQLIDTRIAVKSTTNITRAERFLKAGANGMPLPVGYAYYRAHCLTGDAQVLTRSGWVALADWQGGEIAQWSVGGSIKFAPATPNAFEIHENLVQADSRYHGCTYTKGHTVPTFTSYGTFRPRKAGEALTTRFDIPITGVLDGAADIAPLQAQLAVMVQADGNVRSDISRGLCVRFGFTKARKIERCKNLLVEAGIEFVEAWEGDVCRIRVGAAHYAQLIQLVGPYKQFDKDLWDAPAKTKEAFISELAHWDGDVEPQPNGFTYSTTDGYNAQFVATMAHLSGRAAFISERERQDNWSASFRVYIRKDAKTRSAPKHYEEVPFKGTVYCPTTETGYFMVRQRGHIVVTGNTGRWGGNNKMNMQNLTRAQYDANKQHIRGTGELRLSILAAPGHQISVADSGQIEARVNAWLWDQFDLLEAFRDKRDVYSEFATDIYGRKITKEDKNDRHVGKVCLAADTRVFTNRGLLSIVDVRKTDLLWDGAEWVKHDGLIYQGFKPVRRYRGLSATADHEILTVHGWQAWHEVLTNPSLFQSALSLATLPSCAGITTPVATVSSKATGLFAAAYAAMKALWLRATYALAGLRVATCVPNVPQPSSATGSTSTQWTTTPTGHDYSTVCHPPSAAAQIHATRRTNITASAALLFATTGAITARRFWSMCKPSSAGMTLPWSLTESTTMTATVQVTFALQPSLPTPATSAKSKTWSGAFVSSKTKTHVYDLANAGPRNRFSVMTDDGPVIVHNCVLGLGYQMGAPKLQMTLARGALGGPKIALPLDQCKHIVNTYRRKYYAIKQGWDRCSTWIEHMANPDAEPIQYKCLEIGYEYIRLPNGMSLKYPDLRKARGDKDWDEWSYQSGDLRKKIYGGLLCENLVQALARIIVAEQMLMIDVKYPVVMTTHDECVTHPKKKDAAKCYTFMEKCMTTPLWWCPEIPLAAEGGFADNYSK